VFSSRKAHAALKKANPLGGIIETEIGSGNWDKLLSQCLIFEQEIAARTENPARSGCNDT
jgi:hypothetical protein